MDQKEDSILSLPNIRHERTLLNIPSTQGTIYLDKYIVDETITKEPRPGQEGTLRAECIILKKLKGVPNIVQLKDTEECKNQFVQSDYYYRGDLFDYLVSIQSEPKTKLEMELRFKNLFTKLIDALSTCHSMNIFHLDIKPANIFLKSESNNIEPFLGDFGFAIDTTDSISLDNIFSIKFRGSPLYSPPEKLLRQININRGSPKTDINNIASKIDIYSLGIVFVSCINRSSLITNDAIDPSLDETQRKQRLIQLLDDMMPQYLEGISPELTELLKGMINKNPIERWSMDLIKASDWYNDRKLPAPIVTHSVSSSVGNPQLNAKPVFKKYISQNYMSKYLKYKQKYLHLKNLIE
jgi:serine/threonine protein kinase